MCASKRAGSRRVSVIAPISTYLQRATCFTDSFYIITSPSRREREKNPNRSDLTALPAAASSSSLLNPAAPSPPLQSFHRKSSYNTKH